MTSLSNWWSAKRHIRINQIITIKVTTVDNEKEALLKRRKIRHEVWHVRRHKKYAFNQTNRVPLALLPKCETTFSIPPIQEAIHEFVKSSPIYLLEPKSPSACLRQILAWNPQLKLIVVDLWSSHPIKTRRYIWGIFRTPEIDDLWTHSTQRGRPSKDSTYENASRTTAVLRTVTAQKSATDRNWTSWYVERLRCKVFQIIIASFTWTNGDILKHLRPSSNIQTLCFRKTADSFNGCVSC